jgi:hypothetical protein
MSPSTARPEPVPKRIAVWSLILGEARQPDAEVTSAPSSGAPQVTHEVAPGSLPAWHHEQTVRLYGSVVMS